MRSLLILSLLFINFLLSQATEIKSQTTNRITQVQSNFTYPYNVFRVDQSNNNTAITVPRKSTFELHVEGNPTTGYRVYLKNYGSIDKSLIKFENIVYDNVTNLYRSDDYVPYVRNPENINIVGSGGYYIFRITPIKDFSIINLVFIKIQPWDLKSETGQIHLQLTTSNLSNDLSVKQQTSNYSNSNSDASKISLITIVIAILLLLI